MAPIDAEQGGGVTRSVDTVTREVQQDEGRFLPGPILAERYRIISLLGRGGMGEVYRADDLKLGQPVALKFLPPALEANPSYLSRFINEVRAALRVTHPNVCRVYDVAVADGRHFLSMRGDRYLCDCDRGVPGGVCLLGGFVRPRFPSGRGSLNRIGLDLDSIARASASPESRRTSRCVTAFGSD